MKIRILGDEQGRSTLLSDCCEGRVNFGFRTSANNIYLSFEQGRCFLQLADLKIRIALDVRFGSKADMMCSKLDVRFTSRKRTFRLVSLMSALCQWRASIGSRHVGFVLPTVSRAEDTRWLCSQRLRAASRASIPKLFNHASSLPA